MKSSKEKVIYIFPAVVISVIIGCVILISISGYRSFYRYAGQIKKYAELNNIDAALVAALIQTESGFDKNAVSSKGAQGLMQLMPETAEYIARQVKFNGRIDLKSSECNICLGTAYLAYLSAKFDNDLVVLCAYNAGEGRVSEWLKNSAYSSDGKSLFYIPFKETREYIERVSKYRAKYERIFKQRNFYLRLGRYDT